MATPDPTKPDPGQPSSVRKKARQPTAPESFDPCSSTILHVAGARTGDQGAWERLDRKIRPWLLDSLRHGDLPPTVEPEDAVQVVLMEIFRKFHVFEPGSNFRAWVRQILERKKKDLWRHYRTRKRGSGKVAALDEVEDAAERLHDLRAEAPSGAMRADELAGRLEAALNVLTAQDREILRLRDEALSFSEIGEALGLNETTARSKCHRARANLQAAVSERCADLFGEAGA